MSTATEDDVELKDLVAKVLDEAGVLGKLKAELRAHVYTVLEGGQVPPASSLLNPRLKEFLSTTSGRLVLSLVREFLEFFNLDFTLAVFDPETSMGKDLRYRGRSKLIDALGLTELVDPKSPLLTEVMRLSKVSVLKSESPTPTDVSEQEENTSNQTSLVDDQSKSEKLEKADLRDYKKCTPAEDSSEDSSSPSGNTPQLSLHLDPAIRPHKPSPLSAQSNPSPLSAQSNPSPLSAKSNPSPQAAQSNPSPQAARQGPSSEEPKLVQSDITRKVLEPLGSNGDRRAKELSLLVDLPSIGQKSSLGDLPPLPGNRALAPLKKIQPISKPEPASHTPADTRSGRKDVPNLGFEKDHVISESESPRMTVADKKLEEKKGSEKYSDDFSQSEDIEEDLDSFLNSSQSNPENFTKEEVVPNSDISLQADHVESL